MSAAARFTIFVSDCMLVANNNQSMLGRILLTNRTQRTSQSGKWTSRAQVMIDLLSTSSINVHRSIVETVVNALNFKLCRAIQARYVARPNWKGVERVFTEAEFNFSDVYCLCI